MLVLPLLCICCLFMLSLPNTCSPPCPHVPSVVITPSLLSLPLLLPLALLPSRLLLNFSTPSFPTTAPCPLPKYRSVGRRPFSFPYSTCLRYKLDDLFLQSERVKSSTICSNDYATTVRQVIRLLQVKLIPTIKRSYSRRAGEFASGTAPKISVASASASRFACA